MNIRPYHPTDLTSLYRICRLTADDGGDASPLYSDPDLLGHYYAAPVAVLEPDLCFILLSPERHANRLYLGHAGFGRV